jgi:hypothetical protein
MRDVVPITTTAPHQPRKMVAARLYDATTTPHHKLGINSRSQLDRVLPD